MIMAGVDLIDTYPGTLTAEVVRQEMEGNLCRCTGYHNIVKAILKAAAETRGPATVRDAAEEGAMYPTTYRRPKTLAEAKRMFADAENASFLSGGHTLLPALKLRLANPSDLIDLGAIPELRGIKLEGRTLVIGAATIHADVAASPLVRQHIPALAGLAGSIGDRHVRHRGTIGGSVVQQRSRRGLSLCRARARRHGRHRQAAHRRR